MKIDNIFSKTVLAASILAITACSGSGSDTADSSSSVGVITGFGSIYVNGVKYETDGADIEIDGVSSIETSLGIGDVITLVGSINVDGVTGVATTVTSKDELEGYVLDTSSLLSDGTGSLNIMGQTVRVTLDTVFESHSLASINDLSVLDIVEVSGFPDGAGNILATRVETKNAAEDIEVKGVIKALNTVEETFYIGDLKVDYSAASERPANIADDLFVEVKTESALSGDLGSGFTLVATKVEIEDDDSDFDGDEGDEIKMQGMVSGIDETGFNFNGTRVLFTSLDIDDDFDVASLVEGAMITVEGYIDSNGNFIVEEIEEGNESEDEFEGMVSAISGSGLTVRLDENTSRTFIVNNETRMIDEQDENVEPLHYFSLLNVSQGEYVEVEYYTDGNGDLIATELKREDAPSS